MEVLVINSSGRVVMTSTGFTPDDNEQIPDFNDALSNENGCAYWNGKLSSNESAMSLTRINHQRKRNLRRCGKIHCFHGTG